MSEEDVETGQRGLVRIEEELNGTTFGIVVVTRTNQNAQWLNFEAGALSKQVGSERTRVPFVAVGFDRPSDVTGPIGQFQGVLANRDGLHKLVKNIGGVVSANGDTVEQRFNAFWAQMQEAIESAPNDAVPADTAAADRPSIDDMISEVLGHVRALRNRRDGHFRGLSLFNATLRNQVGDILKKSKLGDYEYLVADDGSVELEVMNPLDTDDERRVVNALLRVRGVTTVSIGVHNQSGRLVRKDAHVLATPSTMQSGAGAGGTTSPEDVEK